MMALLARLSGHERVEAVHQTFASKTSDETLQIMLCAIGLLAALITLLTVANHLQERRRRIEKAERHVGK